MTSGRWILVTCSGVLLLLSTVLVARGWKIGVISGLFVVVSVLILWREAHQVGANRGLDNRGQAFWGNMP